LNPKLNNHSQWFVVICHGRDANKAVLMIDEEDDKDEDASQTDEDCFLGSYRGSEALARSLLDTQVSNELNLLKSEVKRLRSKVQSLQREKDDMVDNFRSTTQILLNRIKELEADDAHDARPQTAAVIDRIEARPHAPNSRGRPEVMNLEESHGGLSSCGNCGRDIPSNNLVSHSVFCYRNNYRCPACDDVIAAKDKESHMEHWTDAARLLDAVWRHDSAMIQTMAAHGVDFAAVHPETQDTVLHASAGLGNVELISFFMGYGVEVDPCNAQGATPLHLASEAAKFLLEMKADPEAGTKLGDTPLQIAQRLGFQETVHALCSAGAPLRPGTPSRARSASPMPPRPKSSSSSSPRVDGAAVPSGYPPPAPRRGAPPVPSQPRTVPRP
ncbi:unnamed protein product, partial [Durusdinium trenchii]